MQSIWVWRSDVRCRKLVPCSCWLSGNSAWMRMLADSQKNLGQRRFHPTDRAAPRLLFWETTSGLPHCLRSRMRKDHDPQARSESKRTLAKFAQSIRSAVINSPADLGVWGERALQNTNKLWVFCFFVLSPKVWDHKLPVELKLATGGWTMGTNFTHIFMSVNLLRPRDVWMMVLTRIFKHSRWRMVMSF